jgi:hypothetical protein
MPTAAEKPKARNTDCISMIMGHPPETVIAIDPPHSHCDSNEAADDGKGHGFDEKLGEDVTAPCTNSHSEAEIPWT